MIKSCLKCPFTVLTTKKPVSVLCSHYTTWERHSQEHNNYRVCCPTPPQIKSPPPNRKFFHMKRCSFITAGCLYLMNEPMELSLLVVSNLFLQAPQLTYWTNKLSTSDVLFKSVTQWTSNQLSWVPPTPPAVFLQQSGVYPDPWFI